VQGKWRLILGLLFFFRDGPLLVVASGRDTISIASSIKRLASQNVFVVQVCL
jgi:mitochondrial fission protein ELM1